MATVTPLRGGAGRTEATPAGAPGRPKRSRVRRFFLLFTVILLLGSGFAIYRYVPKVQTQVNAVLAKVPFINQWLPEPGETAEPAPDPAALAAEAARQQAEANRLANLADELQAKEAYLKELEAELTGKAEQLAALEASLLSREQGLENWEARLEGQEADQADAKRRQQELKTLYSEMKPKAIAATFAGLTDSQALEILRLLEPDQAAKVLEVLDKYRAARLMSQL